MTSFSSPNEFDKERMICNIMDNYQKHCEVLRSVSPELLQLYWIKYNSLVQDIPVLCTKELDFIPYNHSNSGEHFVKLRSVF